MGYVQKLRLPRARLPIREQIEDRSIALAMAGTGLNVENDMSTAATDPADLDPTSDPQDLPELDNTPWKVRHICLFTFFSRCCESWSAESVPSTPSGED